MYHEFEAHDMRYDISRDGVWIMDEGEEVVFLGRTTIIKLVDKLAEMDNQ